MATSAVSGCSATKLLICSQSPSASVPATVAKKALGGASSVMQLSRSCTRRSGSSRQRYRVAPRRVGSSHSGSPLAMRMQRSSTSHDLPIFGAPPRMDTPCGRSVSTQNFVGGSLMSISVSPSMTVRVFLFSVVILEFLSWIFSCSFSVGAII